MHVSHWQDIIDFFVSSNADQVYKKNSVIKANKLSVDRYQLDGEYSDQYITPKQSKILLHFLKGRTAEQIARMEMLSVRTIEDYSKVLRAKFGYTTKSSMVEHLNKLGYQEKLMQIVRLSAALN
ncbi:MAG: helix-turn-helix transcriptional regulator [Coxiellaceae bacterium]|nr:helix-turn-helix transcriptional regulator [Coxiellaceae bacterium]